MDAATLQQLIKEAETGAHSLPAEIENMAGYSAPKVRRLLNALCSQDDASYLEVGVNQGSTLIPALWGNDARATCIDHWQMFAGSRDDFDANRRKFLPRRRINVIDADCFTVDLKRIPAGVNVYFYDGDHRRAAQYNAVTCFAPVLADQFVLLVDDCNWAEPREETQRALKDSGYTVLFDQLLPGAYDGDTEGWWNGLYVALVQK